MLAASLALGIAAGIAPTVEIGRPAASVVGDQLRFAGSVSCPVGLQASTFLSVTVDRTAGAIFTPGARRSCTGRPVVVRQALPAGAPFGFDTPRVRRIWICTRSLLRRPGERAPPSAARQCVFARDATCQIRSIGRCCGRASEARGRSWCEARSCARPGRACSPPSP